MSRSRYEPVPQNDENISLDSIAISTPTTSTTSTTSYNYNTGLPSSASSIITPSTTSSPPPSFHSSQAYHLSQNPLHSYSQPPPFPQAIPNPRSAPPSFHSRSSTPRPTPSTRTTHTNGTDASADYVELWGVADTNTTTAGTEIGTETEGGGGGLMQGAGLRSSNDAVATIIELKRRVERLEEGVGRLLLENEQLRAARPLHALSSEDDLEAGHRHRRSNCCVTFSDSTPEMQRAMMGRSNNCCVAFKGSKRKNDERTEKQRRDARAFMICLAAVVFLGFVWLITGDHRRGESPPPMGNGV